MTHPQATTRLLCFSKKVDMSTRLLAPLQAWKKPSKYQAGALSSPASPPATKGLVRCLFHN